jgi:hypothetical protein
MREGQTFENGLTWDYEFRTPKKTVDFPLCLEMRQTCFSDCPDHRTCEHIDVPWWKVLIVCSAVLLGLIVAIFALGAIFYHGPRWLWMIYARCMWFWM